MAQDNTLLRLNKYIAQCGVASRRGADELVFAGKVTVNGTIADSPGLKVDPTKDTVLVNDKAISQPNANVKDITILLNKPIETVTTAKDPQGRKTVLDLLPDKIRKMRPFPVGRLDFYSEGLLLLTTDGNLCYRLTHPKYHLPKIYRVTIRGTAPAFALKKMEAGMTLDGEKLAPVKIKAEKPIASTQVLEMTLFQGVNRQIRRMCEQCSLTILRLHRVQHGPVTLGKLKPGQWRELTAKELAQLKKAIKL